MRSRIRPADRRPAAGDRRRLPLVLCIARRAAVIIAPLLTLALVLLTAVAASADDTFTEVSGKPNPAPNGQNVTVLARECDRSANVHPTGTITLTDLGSGRQLATGTLGNVVSPFANCADTWIVLSPLNAGQHIIQARYDPSGRVAVTASSASYTQTWSGSDDTFTEVSGTPNPAPNGQNVTVLARECDRSANVHPTGTITLTDLGSGRQLATGTLGNVVSPFANCADTSIVLSPLNAGQHTIQARYDPSGPVAVTASSASYTQTVTSGATQPVQPPPQPQPAPGSQPLPSTGAAVGAPSPSPTVTLPPRISVPDVRNMSRDQACGTLRDAGLRCSIHETSGGGSPGQVTAQSPAPRTLLDDGALVALEVQAPGQQFALPGWVIPVALALIVGGGASVQQYRRRHPPPPARIDVRLRPGSPHVRADETREW